MLFDFLIFFLPIDRVYYNTDLSPKEVVEKVQTILEPGSRYYAKSIESNKFKIRRCISYRNDFLPIVEGYIEPHKKGSKVTINMQPDIFVLIFIPIFLIVILGFAFTKFHFFLLVYLLILVFFKYESFIAKKDLEELFGVKMNN
jgi:hypothetical protein